MTEQQEQLDIGRQAEEFLRYTEEHPYFVELINRIKLTYAQRILTLTSSDRDSFSAYKVAMDAMDEVMNAVRGDVLVAQKVLERSEAHPDQGLL